MEPAKPLAQVNTELSIAQVLNYFRVEVNPTLPPVLPKGGDVYLFIIDDDSRKSECTTKILSMAS